MMCIGSTVSYNIRWQRSVMKDTHIALHARIICCSAIMMEITSYSDIRIGKLTFRSLRRERFLGQHLLLICFITLYLDMLKNVQAIWRSCFLFKWSCWTICFWYKRHKCRGIKIVCDLAIMWYLKPHPTHVINNLLLYPSWTFLGNKCYEQEFQSYRKTGL